MSIENSVSKEVASFFKDPAVSRAVTDMVVRKKPLGWSRRSNSAYYKEVYAMALKEVVDEMMVTRQDQVYFYKDFPSMTPTTLYLKINLSLRYLLDFLDTPEKHYARWNEMVEIKRERGVGVAIRFIAGLRDGKIADFKPRTVIKKDELPKWKQTLDDYLNNPRALKPLHITNLCLTPDEIKSTRESLVGLRGILFNVKSYEIKIIKTNED